MYQKAARIVELAYARNKRGIAGSLIWINFDRHELVDLVYTLKGQFIANADEIRPQFRNDQNAFVSQNAIYQSTLVRDNGFGAGATQDQLTGQMVSAVSGWKESAVPGTPTRSCPSTSPSPAPTSRAWPPA